MNGKDFSPLMSALSGPVFLVVHLILMPRSAWQELVNLGIIDLIKPAKALRSAYPQTGGLLILGAFYDAPL